MSRPVLLDTDVLIDFLRGYDKAVSFVNVNRLGLCLCDVSKHQSPTFGVFNLLSGPDHLTDIDRQMVATEYWYTSKWMDMGALKS